MKEYVKNGNTVTPMLFPYEPEKYWEQIRQIIREEISIKDKEKQAISPTLETPGMTYKPLFKISELCSIFQITKPTIYDWIRHGKLKPFKIRSRVFFLWQDVQQLLPKPTES